jgi:hypothetical protein
MDDGARFAGVAGRFVDGDPDVAGRAGLGRRCGQEEQSEEDNNNRIRRYPVRIPAAAGWQTAMPGCYRKLAGRLPP